MTSCFIRCADVAAGVRTTLGQAKLRAVVVSALIFAGVFAMIEGAFANPLARANVAYASGDYVRAVTLLTPLAFRGSAEAQALLGLMFENGFGAPQVYDTAADLYCQAAVRGNPFGQAMLGLMYDKGHGVPQDFILAYKWLNLAAARAPKHQRDYFLRLRNAVASKMSPPQIAQGQRLAVLWTVGLP
ncbi:hypothetical protein ACVWWO_004662 [Bradyrhizobium sp. F1.13.1]